MSNDEGTSTPGMRARALAFADVAQWLLDHSTGKRVDFYAPSKSGKATLCNAAEALIAGKGPR